MSDQDIRQHAHHASWRLRHAREYLERAQLELSERRPTDALWDIREAFHTLTLARQCLDEDEEE